MGDLEPLRGEGGGPRKEMLVSVQKQRKPQISCLCGPSTWPSFDKLHGFNVIDDDDPQKRFHACKRKSFGIIRI